MPMRNLIRQIQPDRVCTGMICMQSVRNQGLKKTRREYWTGLVRKIIPPVFHNRTGTGNPEFSRINIC